MTRRSAGSWSPPTWPRATAPHRSSVPSSREDRSRRTATGRSTRRPSAVEFTETVAWTLRVRNAGGDVLFEKTGSGSTFQAVWDGLASGAPVSGRHLHGERQRRSTAGPTPRPARRVRSSSTPTPRRWRRSPLAPTPPSGSPRTATDSAARSRSPRGTEGPGEPDRPRVRRQLGAHQEVDGRERRHRGDADLERDDRGRGRCTRRALRDPCRAAGRRRQRRRGRRSQRQAGGRTAVGRLEQERSSSRRTTTGCRRGRRCRSRWRGR